MHPHRGHPGSQLVLAQDGPPSFMAFSRYFIHGSLLPEWLSPDAGEMVAAIEFLRFTALAELMARIGSASVEGRDIG